MERLRMQSLDVTSSNIDKIARLFPQCVTEHKDKDGKTVLGIDFEKLRDELSSDVIDDGEERYQFTWPDKKAHAHLANTPTNKTLRPCREESVDFDHTQNLYIEGDNLDVLKVLRETYLGKVKMIYIDPPYNTGNDFVYNDDFSQSADEYQENSGQTDENGNRLVQNTESNGRFHTDWLNMIYPRLKVAKDLLAEDGVIFISIDDNEVANLRKVCDEMLGESNFVVQLVWKSKSGGANDVSNIACDSEYILVYAKSISNLKINLNREASVTTAYNHKDEFGRYSLDRLDKQSLGYQPSLDFPIIGPDGKIYEVEHKNPNNKVARWRWGKKTVEERYNELVFKYPYVYTKNYEKEGAIPRNLLMDERFGRTRTGKTEVAQLFDKISYFSFPKPTKLILYLLKISADDNSIILDFFSGSATTAHAVMQLNTEDGGNRKFIMMQLPEQTDPKSEAYKAGYKNICEIGTERIRRAGKKIKEENAGKEGIDKLDIGFRVLKLDSSNMQDVYYTPQEFTMNDLFADNVKPDRTAEDLLFQVMLDLGVELSATIEQRTMNGKQVFFVNDNYLVACFDTDITEETIKAIAKLKPYYFVMRDSPLASDNVADNFDQLFETYSKDTIRKIV